MPLVPANLTATITTGLISSGMLGTSVPQLASGIGTGLFMWAQQQTVTTIDAGVLGVGIGVAPFIIPPPLLMANLLATFASNGLIGTMAPLEVTGLANGIALGLAQGMLQTQHPTVGTGAGVGRIIGPPAFSSLMQGFGSVGITGLSATQKASAISMALMMTLQSLVFPILIVGSGSPASAGGVGTGRVW
jgi:hypothetical protein